MLLTINGKNFNISDSSSEESSLSVFEAEVIRIVRRWQSKEAIFRFETSGSTGDKKKIELSREILAYSAKTTLDALDPNRAFGSSLICINPRFIGGTMAIIRALVGNHHLTFIAPTANPLLFASESYFDLVSMVPLQVQTIIYEDPSLFKKVGTVIIGGAPLPNQTIDRLKNIECTRFFHSYGMTETASHFAIKNLKSDDKYQVLGDAQIGLTDSLTLKVCGTVSGNEWIETTDLVSIENKNQFVWIGRSDHIINTGGVKVNPIEVEQVLAAQVDAPFIIAGIPDEKLGQKLILIVESSNLQTDLNLDFSGLSKYHIPKEIVWVPKLNYTETGKINRRETVKELIRQSHS